MDGTACCRRCGATRPRSGAGSRPRHRSASGCACRRAMRPGSSPAPTCPSSAAARRRGALRRRDQRLSVRAVPRHAGEGQRLRTRLARSARVSYTLDLIRILQALVPDGRGWGRLDRAALLQAMDGCGRRATAGRRSRATSCASPRGSRRSTRTRARSSISISSRSPTARWRTPPRPSSSSSAACSRGRAAARAGAARLRVGGGRNPARAHPRLFRLLPLRGRVRGRRRGAEAVPDAGVKIGRVQLSSALDVAVPADKDAAAAVMNRLRPFADTTYLHQVVERRGGELRHYLDLPDVLERVNADPGHADLADSFPRAAVHRRVRRAGIDAALRCRRPAPRARDAGDHAPRDRNVYVGRAAGGPQARSARVDRPRIRVGAGDVSVERHRGMARPAGVWRPRTPPPERGAGVCRRQAGSGDAAILPRTGNAKDGRSQCRRPDGRPDCARRALDRAMGSRRSLGSRRSRVPRRHLHGAVRLSDRRLARRSRHRRQRLVRARGLRGPFLASVEPPRARRRRSGTSRAPRIRPSPARTCSGGSTCTPRRTSASRRGRCIRPTDASCPTSTACRLACATSCRPGWARFRCSISGGRGPRSRPPGGLRKRRRSSRRSAIRR